MFGVTLSLLCSFFLSLSQLSLKRSFKEFPPSVGFLFDSLFGLVLWVPLAIIMGISAYVKWEQAFFYASISAILSEAIVFFALSKGELAVTATILATYPIYTIFFSRILNNEVLSLIIYLFICLTIVGSIIASLPNSFDLKNKFSVNIFWPFLAAICIGLSDSISKSYINYSADYSFLFALGFVQIPIALLYLKIEKQSPSKFILDTKKLFSKYNFALLGGLFNIIGTGFLWLAFYYSPASIASPITGISGALTVVFSRFLFREKISVLKYIGIILAFSGTMGILFTTTS